jgi:hypothetical protein
MASKKIDGVVEAVRYAPDGKVALVRYYERLGPAYSDRKLLTRDQLVEALRGKKRYVAGRRIELMGTSFETGAEIRLVRAGSAEYLQTVEGSGERDNLQGIPQI